MGKNIIVCYLQLNNLVSFFATSTLRPWPSSQDQLSQKLKDQLLFLFKSCCHKRIQPARTQGWSLLQLVHCRLVTEARHFTSLQLLCHSLYVFLSLCILFLSVFICVKGQAAKLSVHMADNHRGQVCLPPSTKKFSRFYRLFDHR